MDKTETTPSDQITLSNVRPLIEYIISSVTPEQWRLLEAGEPDEATQITLTRLLLEFISCISETLLRRFGKSREASEEHALWSNLRITISETFSQVMNIKCVNSEELTALIVTEIRETVDSALSSHAGPEEHLLGRTTPATRVNAMLEHGSKMFQTFAAKVTVLCTPTPHRKRGNYIVLQEVETKDNFEQGDDALARTVEAGPSITAVSRAVQEAVSKEASEITEAVLVSVPQSEYDSLLSETSQQDWSIADDIAKLIVADARDFKRDSVTSQRKTKARCLRCIERVVTRIKAFLVKHFAKTSILHAVTQLMSHFKQKFTKESDGSLRLLIDSAESLIETETGQNNNCRVKSTFSKLKKIFSGKIPKFKRALIDLLHEFFIPAIKPCTPDDDQFQCKVCSAIRKKVQVCLGLTNWWLNNMVPSHSEAAARAVFKDDRLARAQLPKVIREEPEQDSRALLDKRKIQLRVLIEMLVTRTYSKAGVHHSMGTLVDIIEHLLETTWAKVKSSDFEIIEEKTLLKLSKAIFKKLCKQGGSPLNALLLMRLRNPDIEEFLSTSVKHHLTQPSNQRAINHPINLRNHLLCL
ncbi:hypothetical protein Q5P01_026165 [Channa striata]|uniref:Uncharacterized protein n=1 Tax=Channa striata TaxID=64152 RepID=A0AA88IFW2_CHASR|nr:hypothetical protein Q5P01_026165 [Channa striata]